MVAEAVGAPDRAPSGGGRAPVSAAVSERSSASRTAPWSWSSTTASTFSMRSPASSSDCCRSVHGCGSWRRAVNRSASRASSQVALGSLIDDDAVALFTARARAVQPGFAADAARLVELCRRLDGLPLAIELAAARTQVAARRRRSWRVSSIGSGCSSRRAQPAPIARARSRRRSIGATTCSFEHEQRAFRQLAVFAGGFTTDAAEAVCGADALDVVTRLVDKSLLVADTSGTTARLPDVGVAARLRPRPTRRHRRAGGGPPGPAPLVHRRWPRTPRPASARPDQLSWLDRLDDEHDNLQAALTQAAAGRPGRGPSPDRGADSAVVVPQPGPRSPTVGRHVPRRGS